MIFIIGRRGVKTLFQASLYNKFHNHTKYTMKETYTEELIPEKYGIDPATPLQTNGVLESLAILDDLISNDHQYILYHRFGSFFGSIAGHPIDIYHLCAGDGGKHSANPVLPL